MQTHKTHSPIMCMFASICFDNTLNSLPKRTSVHLWCTLCYLFFTNKQNHCLLSSQVYFTLNELSLNLWNAHLTSWRNQFLAALEFVNVWSGMAHSNRFSDVFISLHDCFIALYSYHLHHTREICINEFT